MGLGVSDGVDPVDDFLLLGDREVLIELGKGDFLDVGDARDVEIGDGAMGNIDDENADRIALLFQQFLVTGITVFLNGEADKSGQNAEQKQR